MNVIEEKIKQLEDFEKNRDQIILDLAKDIEHLILDLNTSQLTEKGIDSDGDSIGDYSDYWADVRTGLGLQTKYIDLKFEGDFQHNFFVSYGSDSFKIHSSDGKSKDLENRYGPGIFGLIGENLQEIIDIIRPELIEKLKSKI